MPNAEVRRQKAAFRRGVVRESRNGPDDGLAEQLVHRLDPAVDSAADVVHLKDRLGLLELSLCGLDSFLLGNGFQAVLLPGDLGRAP